MSEDNYWAMWQTQRREERLRQIRLDFLCRLICDIRKAQPENPVLDKLQTIDVSSPLALELTASEQALVRPFLRFEDCFSFTS